MQDEKKVNDYTDRIECQLDNKRHQRPASFGFHKETGRLSKIEQASFGEGDLPRQ
jgi:hypothetical protein